MATPGNTPPPFGTAEWYSTSTGPLHQMMSPDQYSGDSVGSGLEFAFGTAFPEAVGGYPFAYNFTGLGSNGGNFLERIGIASTEKSDRVLGTNYFLPKTNSNGTLMKCAANSSGGCAGKQVHTYIQGYPSKPMGSLPGFVDLLTHFNPGMVSDAIYDAVTHTEPTCAPVTLPVGSALNQCTDTRYSSPGTQLGYRPDVTSASAAADVHAACVAKCASVPSTNVDNCNRECERFWWEGTFCVPTEKSSVAITANKCGREASGTRTMTYKVPYGKTTATGGGSEASMTYSAATQQQSLQNISQNGVKKESFTPVTPPTRPPTLHPASCHQPLAVSVHLSVLVAVLLLAVVVVLVARCCASSS